MKTKPHEIHRNDGQPYYRAKAPTSVLQATVYCSLKNADTDEVFFERFPCFVTEDPEDPTTVGDFEFRWPFGTTRKSGNYLIEFEVNPYIGQKYTLPRTQKELALVIITDDIDAE